MAVHSNYDGRIGVEREDRPDNVFIVGRIDFFPFFFRTWPQVYRVQKVWSNQHPSQEKKIHRYTF